MTQSTFEVNDFFGWCVCLVEWGNMCGFENLTIDRLMHATPMCP